MPSSLKLRSLCLSSISLVALAGCPSDGDSCGPDDDVAQTISAASSAVSLTYGNLSSLAGNDCPDPDAPSGVVSLSIESTLVGGTGFMTFCIPRPDLLAKGRLLGGNMAGVEMRLIDFSANADGCTYARDPAKPPTGGATASGICKNGTDEAGFSLDFQGTINVKRTCGATVEDVALSVVGAVAVSSRD